MYTVYLVWRDLACQQNVVKCFMIPLPPFSYIYWLIQFKSALNNRWLKEELQWTVNTEIIFAFYCPEGKYFSLSNIIFNFVFRTFLEVPVTSTTKIYCLWFLGQIVFFMYCENTKLWLCAFKIHFWVKLKR